MCVYEEIQYEPPRGSPQTPEALLRGSRHADGRSSQAAYRDILGERGKEGKEKITAERSRNGRAPEPVPDPAFQSGGTHG